jgi:hypothetical protein
MSFELPLPKKLKAEAWDARYPENPISSADDGDGTQNGT